MIISRYLLQQVFRALLAVTLVLLLIFISQQLVRYLSYAASGKMAPAIMFQVIGYQIPFLLALMLPPGLYFAILLTYSRLYADNELRILHGCGFVPAQLMQLTAWFALGVALILSVLTFWINPQIAGVRQQTLIEAAGKNALDTLMPGRFRVDQDGERVVYVEKISRDHTLASNIFVAHQSTGSTAEGPTAWTVLSAAKGYQQTDPTDGGLFLVAEKGYRYEGVPGQRNYRIFQFGRHAVRLPSPDVVSYSTVMDARRSADLWRAWPDPKASAELQWRASIPLTALMLALLAVPMSRVPPRGSRYRWVVPAVLIYVIYMNLLITGRHLTEQGSVSVTFGPWWVHLLFLLMVLVISFWRRRQL